MSYRAHAVAILAGVGGPENVQEVFHCVTRLRFLLTDASRVRPDALRAVPAVADLRESGGQLQVVVGNDVPALFAAVLAEAPELGTRYPPRASTSLRAAPPQPTPRLAPPPHPPGDRIVPPPGTSVGAPVAGTAIDLATVGDRTFARGLMGPGLGIVPTSGAITAPVDGTVTAVFATRHAVTLRTEEGVSLLIHVGVDTVNLGGEGFEAHVLPGTQVEAGAALLTVDLGRVGATHDTTVIMVVADGVARDAVAQVARGPVDAGTPVLTVAT